MNESPDASGAAPSPINEAATVAPAPPPSEQATLSHAGAAPMSAAVGGPAVVPGYAILRELGRGGMGVVYQATQIKLDRVVALKMILTGGHAGEADLARFKTEAESVARLQHANIVQIFEVGEHGGLPFFSLEYCPGGSLDKKLNGTPLPPKEAAALVEKLARAMQAAHEKGVVHRDLKPANVLLAADGEPKITDFGLAKKLDADAGQTRTGAVMGTPSYMAPEQAGGKTAEMGPLCDVYALGAILYECLTGRPPFKAATAMDTMMQVVADEPVSPRRLQSKTPRDLETICLKCLEKQPSRRYGTALELAEELRRFSVGEPVRARPVGALERAGKWARRRPALAAAYGLLLAALVLGLGGGGATWLWMRAEDARGKAETAESAAEKARDELNGALQREQDAKRLLTQYSYADRINLAQREWEAGDAAGAKEALREAGALQEELTPQRRPWEWDYLNRLFHPEVAVLEHTTPVCVVFSPDGRRVATAGVTARLWDADSGKLLRDLQGHTGLVFSVAFSPDGRRVATAGSDKTARLWDVASGQQQAILQEHTDAVRFVAFSPDGRRVATASHDHTARLWDAESGKQIGVFQGHKSEVVSVVFSPDGHSLATASNDGTARLWDAETRQQRAVLQDRKLAGLAFPIASVAFSPDGRRVATASWDGPVRLWDAETGEIRAVLQGHKGVVVSVAFSPDGRSLASASLDKTARLWDIESCMERAVLSGHKGEVVSVTFSPDGGRVATGSWDHTARLWDAGSGKPLAVLQSHTAAVLSVAFSSDGRRIATASMDNTALLWDAESDDSPPVLQGHAGPVVSVASRPDGQRVATASHDGTARLWDAATGKTLAVLRKHIGVVRSLAFSPDGSHVATASDDNTARLWDAETGEQLAILRGHRGAVSSVAFSPDGNSLATASFDGTARLWYTVSRQERAILQGHTGQVDCVAFSPDGSRVATASWDKTARLWEAVSGKPLAVLQPHPANVTCVAFSPDGSRVATASYDGTVRLWDVESGKLLSLLTVRMGVVVDSTSVAFSPDGSRLVTAGGDTTARLWDIASGKPLIVLEGHTDIVNSAIFSPDGSQIATTSNDKTARLWIAWESQADQEKRRRCWREQQAAEAEKAGQWFAAAFHLSRLIDETPTNATLYARRTNADARLGRWEQAAADFLQALTRWPPSDADR